MLVITWVWLFSGHSPLHCVGFEVPLTSYLCAIYLSSACNKCHRSMLTLRRFLYVKKGSVHFIQWIQTSGISNEKHRIELCETDVELYSYDPAASVSCTERIGYKKLFHTFTMRVFIRTRSRRLVSITAQTKVFIRSSS